MPVNSSYVNNTITAAAPDYLNDEMKAVWDQNIKAANTQLAAKAAADNYLPFSKDLNDSMVQIGKMIDDVSGQSAPQSLLDAAKYTGRQEAAARGLEGGVAGSLSTAAQVGVQNHFEDQRQARLQSLQGLRMSTAMNAQAAEAQRRILLAQLQAAIDSGDNDKLAAILGTIGMVGGGIIGGIYGGPAGAAAGSSIGGAAGNGAATFF